MFTSPSNDITFPPQMKQLYTTVLLSIAVVGCGKKTQNMAIGNETLKEAKESKTQQTEEVLHQLHDSILKQTKTIKALESQVNQFNSRLIEIEEVLKQNSDKKSKSSEVEPASSPTKGNGNLYLNKKPVASEVEQVDERSSPKAKPKPSSNDLWQAASNGDLEAINILHKAGNSLDEKDASGWTPLFWGVAVDGQKAVKLLLDKGAKVNLTNNDGQTPLDWAIQTKKNEMAELLEKHGAKRGKDL